MKSELFAKILSVVAETQNYQRRLFSLKVKQKNVWQHEHCLCIFVVLKEFRPVLSETISGGNEMIA